MSAEPLIELREVSLYYRRQRTLRGSKKQRVLSDISFPIYAGETVGIIGRNGAGKTTILKLIANLIDPDSGEIVRRTDSISMLSYSLGFNLALSGRENAVHTAMLQGMTQREIESRMPAVIRFSGLEAAIDEPLSSYSSGMKARLGFSVSLQLDPDVLLIDEALGVGDHEFKARSTREMRERMRSQKTVVMVSHDPHTVREICDRAVWIENGVVVMQDIPEKVIDAYHDFDRIVAAVAEHTGLPETQVRMAPDNDDPLEAIAKLRREIRNERKRDSTQYFEKRGVARDSAVNIEYPALRPALSNLVQEDCGSWSWVENMHILARGEQQWVQRMYHEYERILFRLSEEIKCQPAQARNTQLASQMIDLLHEFATRSSLPANIDGDR
jgi:lipopolysaccharide transport system ATP-binding protein